MTLTKHEKAILDVLAQEPKRSFAVEDMAHRLNISGSRNYKQLIKAVAFLERVGEIKVDKQGRFSLKQLTSTVTGVYRANNKGFGFIDLGPEQADLFVPRGQAGNAMQGDRVEAKIIREVNPITGKGSEARIERVLERSVAQMVGEFFAHNQEERQATGYIGYVKPQGDYSDAVTIWINESGLFPANHTICVVTISAYPTLSKPNELEGLVTKEVGYKDAPGVDILAILYEKGIPHEFPEDVLAEAAAVPQVIPAQDLTGRRDLRDTLVITIDGADAKDLDDAISLQQLDNGDFELGVNIADVSHYVTQNSALDREAFERGTSVYLTDRVVPMLPQRLSNGICSLNPHEDRLTLTCQMIINMKGQVVKHAIFPSVIHSSYRMTYTEVNEMIHGNEETRVKYPDLLTMVDQMVKLHEILAQKRHQRGALDFDAPEAKIEVDPEGHPLAIHLRERDVAERLIESFMLIANETVAKHYTLKELPFIYRIHEQPDVDRMNRFAEFLSTFGVILYGDTESIEPKKLQEALAKVKGSPYEQVVSTMMLRSMKQAKYSENPEGHYGLAAQDYTHFTSPIRRYPDLIVHRLIHLYFNQALSKKTFEELEVKIPEIAVHSSKMERRAVDAERETDALKKTEFMADKIGQRFTGLISSVTSFGIFVELPNTVEGLVSLQTLKDDYYQFNQQHMLLVGERTGNIYRIGQEVEIEVVAVNIAEREIDFALVSAVAIDEEEKARLQASLRLNTNRKKVDRKQKRGKEAAKGKSTRYASKPTGHASQKGRRKSTSRKKRKR
ncbi:ribonuclease R [Vaginisenegalia massiliensis]|uniref:ribonuclease R n=1 Tax=Vaginisenegalia massiliensis TaxID=2058294 RepID=UPI000F53E61F|nr:ribonuclease R [Vaginisenegalia massiliensis]